MTKGAKVFLLVATSVVTVLVAALWAVIQVHPYGPVAGWYFQLNYRTSFEGERVEQLQRYGDVMRGRYHSLLTQDDKDAGHYLPQAVDRYLCSRVLEATGEEQQALVQFYVGLAGGREGDCVVGLGKPLAEKLVAELGRGETQLEKTLLLLEEVRLGGQMFKPYLSAQRAGGPKRARMLYLLWWSLPLPWEQKRLIDPLSGMDVQWSSP